LLQLKLWLLCVNLHWLRLPLLHVVLPFRKLLVVLMWQTLAFTTLPSCCWRIPPAAPAAAAATIAATPAA
jgi:hypothetical protein